MKSVVRPELPTAAAGPSQAPAAAVDNSAPRSTRPEPTYKSGKTVQTTGTTSLQSAKLVDDHNEQAMFKYSEWSMSDGGGAPIDTVTFDDQMQLVDSVIKDLEIGEVVPWSTIREALSVPPAAD